MKGIFFLLLTLCIFLSACGLAPTPAPDVTVTLQVTVTSALTPTPAPTETPTPTPGYSIEQLEVMTSDEILALAPEATAGAVKSLYREAPGLVFYQDPETLNITSAYDLTTAQTYFTPEEIPLPAIHITTDRDIFSLGNKYERTTRDPNFDLQKAIDNLANIKDTVLPGEEPYYRLRVLQAYRDGLIPNIPDSVPPPTLKIFDFMDGVTIRPFEINTQDPTWFELKNRSYRDVTIVSDGAGGIRLVQVWKQADGTVGTFWLCLTKESIKNRINKYGNSDFEVLLKSLFDNPKRKVGPYIDFQGFNSCFQMMRDAAFCTGFMAADVRAGRQQAIDEWMATLMIPMTMQNGQIQFPMIGMGQN